MFTFSYAISLSLKILQNPYKKSTVHGIVLQYMFCYKIYKFMHKQNFKSLYAWTKYYNNNILKAYLLKLWQLEVCSKTSSIEVSLSA